MPPKTKVDLKKLEAEKLQGFLLEMMKEEENKYCADCEAKQPRWASWNLGVFLCIRCAGLHRNLGVHISKVKSVNLDSWTPEQVQSMRVMGNAKAKVVYEAELPDMFRRPQSDQALEQFIRAKYEQKRYLLRDWAPPKVDVRDLPSLDLHDKKHPKVSPTPSQGSLTGLSKPPTAGQSAQVKIPVNSSAPALIDESLLDFGEPSIISNVTNVTHPTGNVIDLMSPDGSTDSSGPIGSTPIQGKSDDLDEIFGTMVSAPPPMTSSVSAGATPSIEHPPLVGHAPQDSASLGNLGDLNIGPALDNEKKSISDILSLFGTAQPKTFVQQQQQPVQSTMPQMLPNMGSNNFNIQGRPLNTPPVQSYGVQQIPPQMYNQIIPNLAQPGLPGIVPMHNQMIPNTQPIRPTGAYGMDGSMFGGSGSGFSSPPAQASQPAAKPAFNPNAFSMFGSDNSLTFNAFSGSSNSTSGGTLNPTQSSIPPSNNTIDLDFGDLNLGVSNTQSVVTQPVAASTNRNDIDLLFS